MVRSQMCCSDAMIPIDAAVIAESSLQSLNYHSGILILEEYLLQSKVFKPACIGCVSG